MALMYPTTSERKIGGVAHPARRRRAQSPIERSAKSPTRQSTMGAGQPPPQKPKCWNPFRAASDALYGIGPPSLAVARVVGLLLIAGGAAVYLGLTIQQYVTQTPVTRSATLVVPLQHPDLVLCGDRLTRGFCSAGAMLEGGFRPAAGGLLQRRQDGEYEAARTGCDKPAAVEQAVWDTWLQELPSFGVNRTFLAPGPGGAVRMYNTKSPGFPYVPLELATFAIGGGRVPGRLGVDVTNQGPTISCWLYPISGTSPVQVNTSDESGAGSYSLGMLVPVPSLDEATFVSQRDSPLWAALVHPRTTADLLSGKTPSLGRMDFFTVDMNTQTDARWTLRIDRTVGAGSEDGGGRYRQRAPGGQVYSVQVSRERMARFNETTGDDGYYRYFSLRVATANPPAGGGGALFTVQEDTSVNAFTVVNVLTAAGALLTWSLVAYRFLFGSVRLRPFGVVQAFLLRGAYSARLRELYGEGWDPELGRGSMTRRGPKGGKPDGGDASVTRARSDSWASTTTVPPSPVASLPPSTLPHLPGGTDPDMAAALLALAERIAALEAGASRDLARRTAHLETVDRLTNDLYLDRAAVLEMLGYGVPDEPQDGAGNGGVPPAKS
ncbi:hypothetical protein DFJ74DRAFT_439690 [Hyaloraphidium curvatum]|nr:hypothetical protein DFJ74DRAFT_439690 [Hyaloraphidium curvatum]